MYEDDLAFWSDRACRAREDEALAAAGLERPEPRPRAGVREVGLWAAWKERQHLRAAWEGLREQYPMCGFDAFVGYWYHGTWNEDGPTRASRIMSQGAIGGVYVTNIDADKLGVESLLEERTAGKGGPLPVDEWVGLIK